MGLSGLFFCSRALLAAVLLFSAAPLAVLVALERTKLATTTFEYRSRGWVRECAKWDDAGRRFLVSTFFDGGVAQVAVPEVEGAAGAHHLEERPAVQDADVAGNASVGILVDRPRERLLVAYSDVLGNRYGALGAYEMGTWRRLFLTRLSGPGDEPSDADDVAVDGEGNAYVTDAKSNKLWKLGPDGQLLSVIRSPVFTQSKDWYRNLVGLNGIVHHPNGYLLVVHTFGGQLFRVDPATEEVTVVDVAGGSLLLGDGLELLSPTKLVVAGTPSGRVVESQDDWRTAAVTAKYKGPMHRIAASATVKDGKVYLSHLIGGGVTRWTHLITEAVFSPVNA
uniref:Tripartite motif-containing protein 71 n=1 Tax=Anthurium amnicola TaxID=1678845 RepID=A0A1D1YWA9_9ARAE